jgi:hypothetical protein
VTALTDSAVGDDSRIEGLTEESPPVIEHNDFDKLVYDVHFHNGGQY